MNDIASFGRDYPVQYTPAVLAVTKQMSQVDDATRSLQAGRRPDADELKQYIQILNNVEKDLGKGITYMDQLENYGEEHLGKCFRGVYMLDTIPALSAGECCIANTDPSSLTGKHWVAIKRGDNGEICVYDSFGRKPARLMPGALRRTGGSHYGHVDDDAEQAIRETNCGQRCLAWLIFAQKYGLDSAKLI